MNMLSLPFTQDVQRMFRKKEDLGTSFKNERKLFYPFVPSHRDALFIVLCP
jgi:hypothetical protein